ncbi:MAG: carbonic anhydrase [Candidatus Micrarchaeia archaeon]
MESEEALDRLLEGNRRFVSGILQPKDFVSRRDELKSGQHPMATIVCCSDSRVVPEYIFDVGIGDVFTVVSAGNVVDKIGLGSVEYAVGHLHTPVLIVMGHERCGAVKAAYHDHKESNITAIVKKIMPSVKRAKRGGAEDEECEKAAALNVKAVIRKIRKSPIVKGALDAGKLRIVGLKYRLDGSLETLS